MIAADAITAPDDQGRMWMACPNEIEHDSDPDWLRLAFWHGSERPCDLCGTMFDIDIRKATCPTCHGTGRHVFEIEVEPHGTECECRACLYGAHRTLLVHVVPGMVLPIVADDDAEWSRGRHIFMGRIWEPGKMGPFPTDYVTLPPAAKPGMWAVQLQQVPS